MTLNEERLSQVSKPRSKASIARANARKENRERIRMSQDIALNLHYYMRVNGIKQKELADKMGVSSAYMGKLLKGDENLTLDTICKIHNLIGLSIVSVKKPYISQISLKVANNIDFPSDAVKSDKYCNRQVSKKNYTIASQDVA